jgi:nitroimidazol reductase NimA-like FMN-containing flavoprotein (pyridoxamine 5'-phosphate oxidase superfamily)
MTTWAEFEQQAPHIAEIFNRRHAACGNLCLLATVRADGSPRISPMEPRRFEGHLVLVGMPGTTKFVDLARDPRFCLHTATIDTKVSDGDAKVWGTVRNLQDPKLHRRFAEALFAELGMDLREERFDPFYVAEVESASSVELNGDQLEITIWKRGEAERLEIKR